LFGLEKAAYEVAYEAENRPTWLPVPLHGLYGLLRGLNPFPILVESSHEFLEQGTGKAKKLLPSAGDIDALVRAEHPDPFSILGPHGDGKAGSSFAPICPVH
jgi:hypothetical protein